MKKYVFFLFLLTPNMSTFSQNLITTAGTSLVVEDLTISWSIGEPFTKTLTNHGIQLTQGFHQPESGSLTINHFPVRQETYSIFPNPSHGDLFINTTNNIKNLKITLTDLQGRVFLVSNSIDVPSEIHLPPVSKGLYILMAHHEDNTCAFRKKIAIH